MPIKPPRMMLLFLLLLLPAAAPGSDLPDATVQLVEQLGATEYKQRQAATTALLADRTLTDDQFVALYARSTSVEQRHRLMAVAKHHLLRRSRQRNFPDKGAGAIGTAHEPLTATQLPHLSRPAIRVTQPLPGLPAYEKLLPGDLILAVDGSRLPPEAAAETISTIFVSSIEAKQPGRTVRLTVLRGDQHLDVTLPLTSSEALNEMYEVNAQQPPGRNRRPVAREIVMRGGRVRAEIFLGRGMARPEAAGISVNLTQLKEPFDRQWKQLHDRLKAAGKADHPPNASPPQ